MLRERAYSRPQGDALSPSGIQCIRLCHVAELRPSRNHLVSAGRVIRRRGGSDSAGEVGDAPGARSPGGLFAAVSAGLCGVGSCVGAGGRAGGLGGTGGGVREVYAAPVGRPSYPLRVLIKALLVEAWWNLSDPKAKQLLRNDLRFRRFLGVGLVGKTPDRNTLWRFGDELSKRGLAERLVAEVDRQLREKGLVLRRGSLVDATLIRSAVSSNNRRKEGTAVEPAATGRHRTGEIPSWATSAMRRWARPRASCARSPSRRHPATSRMAEAACRRMWDGCGQMRSTLRKCRARASRHTVLPR